MIRTDGSTDTGRMPDSDAGIDEHSGASVKRWLDIHAWQTENPRSSRSLVKPLSCATKDMTILHSPVID
jgi:hypothetical protein